MVNTKILSRWVVLGSLVATSTLAQSEHVVLPPKNWRDPVTITLTGKPDYFRRYRMEVEGVSAAEQAIYQSSWSGELGLRVAGLKDAPYRVHLAYTEMDMTLPHQRFLTS